MRKHASGVPVTALVFALGGLLAAAPGQAQDQQNQPAQNQGQQQAQTEEIPQEELDRYAAAYLEIAQIRQRMQQQMQNAGDQQERQSLRQEANQQMSSILEDHGISVQRYREITNVLNSDQQQRQEFTSLVQEKRQESDSGDSGGR